MDYYTKQTAAKREPEKTGWESKSCQRCGFPGFQPVKGIICCKDCYSQEYEKAYEFKATPEQIARFLISMGSGSIYWEKATEGQRQYAKNFYKAGHYKPYSIREIGGSREG